LRETVTSACSDRQAGTIVVTPETAGTDESARADALASDVETETKSRAEAA
jgi:hypothetical protein